MTFYVRITHLPTNTVYNAIATEYTEEDFKSAVDLIAAAVDSISNGKVEHIQLDMTNGVVMIPAQVAKECAFEIIKSELPFNG